MTTHKLFKIETAPSNIVFACVVIVILCLETDYFVWTFFPKKSVVIFNKTFCSHFAIMGHWANQVFWLTTKCTLFR